MKIRSNVINWVLSLLVAITAAIVSNYIITKTARDSKRESSSKQESISDSNLIVLEKSFIGNVGKWEAKFDLTFDYHKKSVIGSYSYPKRPGITYDLKGAFKENYLELIEYSDGRVSSESILTLSNQGTCYDGFMKNSDGRNLVIKLCEE